MKPGHGRSDAARTVPGPRSLLRRLWLWTAAAVAVVGAATAVGSYLLGYREADTLQDAQLRQIGILVQRLDSPPSLVLPASSAGIERDANIVVERLGTPAPALPLPPWLAPGLHDVAAAGSNWRVYVRDGRHGRIAVAQRAEVRIDAAEGSAQRALLPLLALVPVLALSLGWVVRRALRPVRELAAAAAARDGDRLDPLPLGRVPDEIRPFIAAINLLLSRVATMLVRERRFLADAAHELRTPIAALSLQAGNLGNSALPPDAAARLGALQDGLARTRAVVEQLLSLARVQSGRGLALRPVDPAAVVRLVVQDLLPLATQRDIDLGVSQGSAPALLADATQLYTLLRNAVDNAVRYTPRGGRVDISLSHGGNPPWIAIEVRDTGPGIPEAHIAQAFEPFERIGADATGSGLGLAIVRSIAQNLGGSVSLHNLPGGGLVLSYRQPALTDVPT